MGGDNVDTVAVVVGEGRAKVVSAVSVGIPRETVVGTVERQTELAGGMEWVGGKVIWKAVKIRPGREGRIRAEAEAARGRKRGLRWSWGRDGTMGAVCGEGVVGTAGGGGM